MLQKNKQSKNQKIINGSNATYYFFIQKPSFDVLLLSSSLLSTSSFIS
jgi:hypothetical protein